VPGPGRARTRASAGQARAGGARGGHGDGGGRTRPPTTGRELARHVLARVEEDGAYANRALAAALDRAPAMSSAERGLATELVYGVLRRRARLDRALEAVADRGLAALPPSARTALRVGAYQLLFLDRVPGYAAVNDAVETMKRAHGPRLGGLANALLRRVSERGEPPLPDPEQHPGAFLEEACGWPPWLARLALRELGAAPALALGKASGTGAPVALRANRLAPLPAGDTASVETKGAGMTRDVLAERLVAERPGVILTPSTVAPDALLARGLDAPARTRAFADGAFAIEDVGAQVVAELCGAAPGERILDACAGLGGKTAHLAALAGNQATIEALDLSAAKLRQAEEQWARLGVRGVQARAADLTKDFPPDTKPYDRVLIDAPCSGLGVLRRHPEILLRRSEADLALLAATGRRMLDVVSTVVAPGGALTYAVCTFDRVEGEDVVRAFVAAHPEFTVEPPSGGGDAHASGVPWDRLAAPGNGVRLWPDRDEADAFFAVRLRRRP